MTPEQVELATLKSQYRLVALAVVELFRQKAAETARPLDSTTQHVVAFLKGEAVEIGSLPIEFRSEISRFQREIAP